MNGYFSSSSTMRKIREKASLCAQKKAACITWITDRHTKHKKKKLRPFSKTVSTIVI
jgi:hypothetical protein